MRAKSLLSWSAFTLMCLLKLEEIKTCLHFQLQREALSAWRALRGLCRELRKGGKDSGGQNSIEHLSTSSSGCSSSSEGEEECDMNEDEGLGSLKVVTKLLGRKTN